MYIGRCNILLNVQRESTVCMGDMIGDSETSLVWFSFTIICVMYVIT